MIHYENSLQQTCTIIILGNLKLLSNMLILLPFQRCSLECSTYSWEFRPIKRFRSTFSYFDNSVMYVQVATCSCNVCTTECKSKAKHTYDMTRNNTCIIIGIARYICRYALHLQSFEPFTTFTLSSRPQWRMSRHVSDVTKDLLPPGSC